MSADQLVLEMSSQSEGNPQVLKKKRLFEYSR